MPDLKRQGGARRGAGRKGKTEVDRRKSQRWNTIVYLSIGADA